MFVSVGVIDSGTFKGVDEIDKLRETVVAGVEKYVTFARNQGWSAESETLIGTEAVAELDRLCREVALRFPRSVFFAGQRWAPDGRPSDPCPRSASRKSVAQEPDSAGHDELRARAFAWDRARGGVLQSATGEFSG